MDRAGNTMESIGNDPFYAKIFLVFSFIIFIVISIYYYIGNPLNIYHFIGLRTIIFTLFVIFYCFINCYIFYIF